MKPKIVRGFLEYAQARDFAIATTRTRHQGRRAAVPMVRDDCFGGEWLLTLDPTNANPTRIASAYRARGAA